MATTPSMIKILNKELDTFHKGRRVSDLKAIVNHWTAAPGQKAFNTMHYCIYKTGYTYHYFVDRDGTIYEFTKFPYRANQCGATVYTKQAVERFPRYCPPTDHTVVPHNNTPNNITLGICGAVEDWDGNMTSNCYNSLIIINAYAIVKFAKDLDVDKDIVLHSFFTDKKECHKYFVRNPQEFIKFKQKVKYLVSVFKDDMIKHESYGLIIEPDNSITRIEL